MTSVLPTPVGSCQQETANRPAIAAEARACHLDRGGQRIDGGILAEDHELQVALEVLQHFAIRCRDMLGRYPRDARDDRFNVRHCHRGFPLGHRFQPERGARLVDDVDRLVRQVPVIDVALRELRRSNQRIVVIADTVMLLESRLQPAQDLDRFRDARLDDVDLLEAPGERVVLLEDAAVFLVGGRSDAAQFAVRKHRLDQVGRVHDATGSSASADHGVDLVDEQYGAGPFLQLGDDTLQALLEIAAVLRAGYQCPHVERIDRAVREHLGNLAFDHEARKAFGDRGLADAGLADIERVVLAAPAQDLDRPLHFELAADQRIDLSGPCQRVQVGRELLERGRAAVLGALAFHRNALLTPGFPRFAACG